MPEQNRRIDYIDFLRGLAIFFMLWGHAIQYSCIESDFFENPVHKIIYSFHMPLFMIISGYCFAFSINKHDFKYTFKKSIDHVLLPIFSCSVFICLFANIPRNILKLNFYGALNSFRDVVSGDTNGGLWFLWSLFAIQALVLIAWKISNRIYIRLITLTLLFAFLLCMPYYENNIYLYPFFVLGFLYRTYENNAVIKRLYSVFKWISLVAFPILCLFYKKSHYIWMTSILKDNKGYITPFPQEIKIMCFRYCIGFFGCIFVIAVSKLFYSFFVKRFKKLTKPMEMIGQYSLQVYVVSCIILSTYYPFLVGKLTAFFGSDYFDRHQLLLGLVAAPVIAALSSLVCLIISRLMEKAKISKYIFNK